MTERPTYFREPSSDAMVRALLDGSKTQTRRPVNLHFIDDVELRVYEGVLQTCCVGNWTNVTPGPSFSKPVKCPFGVPGDLLWVKECWQVKNWSDGECAKAGCPDAVKHPKETMYGFSTRAIYRASYNNAIGSPGLWRPSIHMPRWASRITRKVKRTWVERLQDISKADALAEGLSKCTKDDGRTWKYGIPDRDGLPGTDDVGWPWREWQVDPVQAFYKLWDSIYATKGYGWAENPWVWGCEFERE